MMTNSRAKGCRGERAEGLQKVLKLHCCTCVEDLPKEALKAHQVRYGVGR